MSLPAQHASDCIKRADMLLQENEFGRAMRALMATPNFSVDEGNDEVVRALFPPGPAAPPQSLKDLESIPPRISAADVERVLKRKSKRTTAGPSRVSYAIFKKSVAKDPLWSQAIAVISQAYLDGWFGSGANVPNLSATILTLLQKEAMSQSNATPRPLGVGECLFGVPRSIAASDSMRRIAPDHKDEYGLGIPDGTAKLFARVLQSQSANPDMVILKIDCSNAFNTIHRMAILEGIRRWAPELLSAFYVTYGKPTAANASHSRTAEG